MFEREHHRRIAIVLEALNADLFAEHHCLFGGGTAIAMRYGEYRESVDIDFLISDRSGYGAMRQRFVDIGAVLRRPAAISQERAVRADRDGIRTVVAVDDVEIKFEIVLEGRIDFAESAERVCGIACLTTVDMAASKLLANSDRWPDDSVFNRDAIDLAMMQLSADTLREAIDKADAPYKTIRRDLANAIGALRLRPGHLDACMEALKITTVPKAVVLRNLIALADAAQ